MIGAGSLPRWQVHPQNLGDDDDDDGDDADDDDDGDDADDDDDGDDDDDDGIVMGSTLDLKQFCVVWDWTCQCLILTALDQGFLWTWQEKSAYCGANWQGI